MSDPELNAIYVEVEYSNYGERACPERISTVLRRKFELGNCSQMLYY